jgi:hypothetical protein
MEVGTSEAAVGGAKYPRVLVRTARRLAAGSVVWALVVGAARWLRQVDERIGVGLRHGWSAERANRSTLELHAVAADSRIVAGMWSAVNAPWVAWRDSRLKRLWNPVLRLERQDRLRTVGVIVAVAVLTNALILAASGVRAGAVGWGTRLVLVAASALLIGRPQAVASALSTAWWRRTLAP